MENLIIYGAGDLGHEYVWLTDEINKKSPTWNLVGFIDDNLSIGTVVLGYSVLGGADYFDRHQKEINVICSVADNAARKKIIKNLQKYSWIKFPILIHPSSIVSNFSAISEGTVIGPGCVISVGVFVGNHVVINQNSSISHNVCIEDYAMIAPSCNLGGHVKIGEGVNMGIGCTAMLLTSVGEYAVLGAGAVVVKDIPAYCVAVGIPAKPIKSAGGQQCTENT